MPKQTAEKSETIFVGMGDSNLPTATVQVSYDAVQVKRETVSWNVQVAFPPTHKDSVYPFKVERAADADFQIVDANTMQVLVQRIVVHEELRPARALLGAPVVEGGTERRRPPLALPTNPTCRGEPVAHRR